MHIETLQTPHPKKEQLPGEIPASIAENLGMVGLRQYTTEQVTELSESETLLAASYAQQIVRRALVYAERSPYQSFETTQETTCIGYTVAGSEALEALTIRHWVGFANGHGFLMVPHKERIWLFDMLSPELNGEVSDNISRGTMQSIEQDITTTGRAAVVFHSETIGQQTGKSRETLEEKYPWLTTEQRTSFKLRMHPGMSEEDERSRVYRNQKLILALFDPAKGRDVLRAYAEFHEALDSGKHMRATQRLKNLAGQYPDLDARGSAFKDVKRLVRVLTASGHGDQAKAVIGDFFSSFSFSGDTRLTESRGDCLRIIAKTCGDSDAAAEALTCYQSIINNPKSSSCIATKADDARSLVATLST